MRYSPSELTKKPPAPRWVKIFGIIAAVVVVLVAVALMTGLGGPGAHGPGRHVPGDDATEQASPGDDGGHVPPPGVPDHG